MFRFFFFSILLLKERHGNEILEISRDQIKWIAMITMLADHIGYMFVSQDTMQIVYYLLRALGRISFPLICFLVAEGFVYTHSCRKYMLRMGIFAVLSEIPFDLAFSGHILDPHMQNVLWTLEIGLMVLCGMQYAGKALTGIGRQISECFVVAAGMAMALVSGTDYSFWGILMIVVFYVCRYDKKTLCVVLPLLCICQGRMEVSACLALIPIYFYSPQKNNGKTVLPGYFFYWFYPAHLLVLWWLAG